MEAPGSSDGRKAVCVFDFDGTLVDSMGGFADLAAGLIKEAYLQSSDQSRADYLRTSGLPFYQQLEVLFPGDSRNAEVAQSFERRKQRDYLSRPFFEEVPEAIRCLREQGVKVVVSSNNGQELVEEFLERKGNPRFDLVLGFRQGFAKGRDHFNKVLDHFHFEAEDMLFIGDSLHDAEQAREFGVDFVGRLGTFSAEQFREAHPGARTIRSLEELSEVLCR